MKGKKLTLTQKLMFIGGTIVLASLLATSAVSVWKSSHALNRLGKDNSQRQSEQLATLVRMVLEEEVQKAKAIASLRSVVDAAELVSAQGAEGAQEAVQKANEGLISIMRSAGQDYEGIFLSDASGLLYGGVLHDGNTKVYPGVQIKDRDYFKRARETGKAVIGDVIVSKITNEPVAVICVPLLNKDGRFLGILGTSLKIGFLTDTVSNTKVGTTGYAYMTDKEGTIIAHPNKDLIFKLNLHKVAGLESLAAAMDSGKAGVVEYQYKGDDKISGYAPVGINGWMVGITQTKSEFLEPVRAMAWTVGGISGVAVLITLVVFFLFSRKISKPILVAVEGLTEGADQVAAASSQVSSASQQLAEGSSEQAASLEETSSALEEMSSMTRQNADNAKQADSIVKASAKDIAEARQSMQALTQSMGQISQASAETQKIIKTIDEIAFQTNLLALNAAVEAARAGEAGAGFAVVADEVRNLAMRSAEAAKNTAQLIEDTVKKVSDGESILKDANEAFGKVAEGSTKIGELVGEIAAASSEQAEGIGQVNRAVSEMDKVVQRNAATAEESASAAEELNAQAEQMRHFVQTLADMVGFRAETGSVERRVSQRRLSAKGDAQPGGQAKEKTKGNGGKRPFVPEKVPAQVKPEELIPFDDDFSEF
ncbi:methyl-accepting chemotaxis protein [Desulfacinum infernum DSM 9756]|uniref:Methyl-accepting chemotaxis protein n=1 Tax=Desulfacinum infernum DSM 9756 TaxID=1121391 RepID=A0A1M5B4Q1_9BACT|nr:methyl-accepting chemotaxis protein [Desulfacinum infernum]SHF37420.1 methyl-accepting chemotaxis protein [Desulfacinum infernum DSM 9756]